MSVNEQQRQKAISVELEELARTLAHSTRDVPIPSESYDMLGALTATIDSLEQVCRQLAGWHQRVIDGIHYQGEDATGDGATGTVTAAAELDRAAIALASASTALSQAHSANGVVRWLDTPAPQ